MKQVEESKHDECYFDIHHAVEILARQEGANAYMRELWIAFSKARDSELEMKAKAAESQKQEEEQPKDKKTKKKGKEAVTSL